MKLHFFDIPISDMEKEIERDAYDAMSDEELDRSSLPLTGPYVSYADYLALEAQIRGSKGNG